MKKLKTFLKFLIIGVLWTYFCIHLTRHLMLLGWKFDIFYPKQWNVLAQYWDNDGVIASAADYMFFVVLLVMGLLWIWGVKRLYKVDYIRLMLVPFKYFNDRKLRQYEQAEKHVVIKNISVGEKLTVEDVIKQRLKQEPKVQNEKASSDLRQKIAKKITERKDQ